MTPYNRAIVKNGIISGYKCPEEPKEPSLNMLDAYGLERGEKWVDPLRKHQQKRIEYETAKQRAIEEAVEFENQDVTVFIAVKGDNSKIPDGHYPLPELEIVEVEQWRTKGTLNWVNLPPMIRNDNPKFEYRRVLRIVSEKKEPCPNCKETVRECGCVRNKCIRCGGPVGNITFTVCENCWDKETIPEQTAGGGEPKMVGWFKHMEELDKAKVIIKRRLIELVLEKYSVVADKDNEAIAEEILFEIKEQPTPATQESHKTLRVTPAMEAGIAKKPMTLEELVSLA